MCILGKPIVNLSFTGKLEIGKRKRLHCRITGEEVKVEWWKSGMEISGNIYTKTQGDGTVISSYLIRKFSKGYEGVYQCKAITPKYTVAESITLKI